MAINAWGFRERLTGWAGAGPEKRARKEYVTTKITKITKGEKTN
jgi:hypothetical protein